MDRRLTALTALMFFIVATAVAIVLDGRLPASEESVTGWVLQVLGYLAALAGGVLLLTGEPDARTRRYGLLVVAAVVLLAITDAGTAAAESDGAVVGLGFVRLIGLVVLAVVTIGLARSATVGRQSR
jgi:hypothetical protein